MHLQAQTDHNAANAETNEFNSFNELNEFNVMREHEAQTVGKRHIQRTGGTHRWQGTYRGQDAHTEGRRHALIEFTQVIHLTQFTQIIK